MRMKVRKTLTLDSDVVEEFGEDAESLSAAVNAVLRSESERRARLTSLAELVAELEAEHGSADADLVAEFRAALQ